MPSLHSLQSSLTKMRCLLLIIFFIGQSLGCQEDDPSSTSGETTAGETTAGEMSAGEMSAGDTYIPQSLGVDDPPPPTGRWAEYLPGGDTVCSRGGEYRFFVRGGDPNKVIIDFEGGGACWDAFTCSIADSIFKDSVRPIADFTEVIQEGRLDGIYGTSEDHPYRDWTIIHIPYCTGDIHWGNATQMYSDNLTIEHRGFVNVTSALDWLERNYEAPRDFFVTGCSAGAYGAALHSAYIARRYPMSKMVVMADSGAGVITQDFLERSLPNWEAEVNLPPWIEGLQRPATELSLAEIYIEIARAHPEARFSQYTTSFDADQMFYFTAMGGDRADWSPLMRESFDRIESEVDNFRSFVAPGPMHCVIPYPFLSERVTQTESGEVTLSTWMDQLINGENLPTSARCEGEACYDDFVCTECLNGSATGGYCRFCQGWPDNARFDNP